MSLTTPSCVPDAAADEAGADAAYYRATLHELIELGMGVAREVASADCAVALAEKARAFDLVSRAVRRTVRLAAFLRERAAATPGPARAQAGRVQAERAQPGRADAGERRRVALRAQGLSQLTDAELDQLERLEGLDGVEAVEGFDRGRPVDEVIEEIRCDLGLCGTDACRRLADGVAPCPGAAGRGVVAGGLNGGRPAARDWAGRGFAPDTS